MISTRPFDDECHSGRILTINKEGSEKTKLAVTNNGWTNAYSGVTCNWIAIGY